jgi:hypothetical protein
MTHCLVNHHICNWPPSVCSCSWRVSYDVSCDSYSGELRISGSPAFIQSKNMSAMEMHRELFAAVYGRRNCKTMVSNVLRRAGEQMFTIKSKVVGHCSE